MKMTRCKLLFFFGLLFFVDSYKILVYNVRYAHSVSNYMGSMADILVDAGHQVDVLIPVIKRDGKDGTEKARRIYVHRDQEMPEYVEIFMTDLFDKDYDNYQETMDIYILSSVMFAKQCNETLHYPGLIKQLTEERYDLFIAETIDFCGVGLSHLIGARTLISVATSPIFDKAVEYMGMPTSPSINPAWTTSSLDVHSMWSRAMNLYRHWLWKNSYISLEYSDELFQSLYGPTFPHIGDLVANSAYYFANMDPYIDFARPTLNKIVELGGLGIKEANPLEEAIAKFPDITFIWKYEDLEDSFAKEEASRVQNVILETWVPQNDILSVFIPLYVDQPRNAAIMAHSGMGIVFSKFELANSAKLTEAIHKILNDKSYAEKAKRISRMLARRPFTPRETLIKYVEFAAEFGASENLRPLSVEMSAIELYNLDLLFISSIICLSILYFSYKLLTTCNLSPSRKLKTA